jgi:hypothetical protein
MVALPRAKDGQMGKVVVINHVTLDGVMQGSSTAVTPR